jgi:P-type E1-E2 ATPase
MKVDQRFFYPDDDGSEMVTKQCSYLDIEEDIALNPDNILLQDSIVMTGCGKAVILAVGSHTLKEKELREDMESNKYALQIEKEETPFQYKLRILSEIIGAYAYMILVISLILFAITWLLFVMCSDYKLVDAKSIKRAIDLATTAIALLIVCIPEGMPLVISMAMAFSVDSLKKENLLIKNLDALETSGQIIDILTGKTATLTTGDMEVARINLANNTH